VELASLLDKHLKLQESDLFRVKPPVSALWGIDQAEEACYAEYDSDDALNLGEFDG
jgi:hypothetical protein